MYWASHRSTTRPEDRAYSLMGIFDVNMPLLYGEGEKKAFRRLQQEIIKISTDQYIFAWDESSLVANGTLLASSPDCFRNAATIIPWWNEQNYKPFTLTNGSLALETQLLSYHGEMCAVLNCRYEDNLTGPICLRLGRLLQSEREDDEDYGNAQSQSSVVRISRPFQIHPARRRPTHLEHRYTRLIVKSIGEVLAAPVVNFTIALHDDHASHWRYLSRPRTITFQMLLDDSIERCFEIVDAWPPTQWNPDTLVMRSTWKRDELVAAELKQRLAAADVSESPFISLKCPDEQFGIFAHCSLPYVVMDAEVQEIRVTTSTFTDIATKDEGARLDGTKAGKLGKLYGFKKMLLSILT
nr:vegetative incompatibility protein het-e-1 [Quercus suber]